MRTAFCTWFVALVVLAAGASRSAGQTPSDNLVIVLDASGSMGATMQGASFNKMEAAKQALLKMVGSIPAEAKVGLLIFSGVNVPQEWAFPLQKVDRPALEQAIRQPEPYGGTPLGEYLKKAADTLLEERKKQRGYGTFRLLVVTDGEADNAALVDAYVPDILARGITVDCIGVDMAEEHTLAQKVHSYRRANDPEALVRAVAEVVAEVGATGNDDLDTQQFELLAGLDAKVAAAALTALSTTGNDPIGGNDSMGTGAVQPDGSVATPGVFVPAGQAQGGGGGGGVSSGLGVFCCSTAVGIPLVGAFVIFLLVKSQQARRH